MRNVRTTWRVALPMACAVYGLAAHAAHPLFTDDTGTQGKGGWEVELGGQHLREQRVRASELGLQVSYGVTDALDVLARPAYVDLRSAEADVHRTRGWGDADVGVKWRFAGRHGFSVGMRGDLLVPTGSEERGLGAGRTTYRIALLATAEGEAAAFHANAGYLRTPAGEGVRRDLGFASAAGVWSPRETLHLSAELISASDPDRSNRNWALSSRVGVIGELSPVVRADAGLERRLSGGPRQTIVLAGITWHW